MNEISTYDKSKFDATQLTSEERELMMNQLMSASIREMSLKMTRIEKELETTKETADQAKISADIANGEIYAVKDDLTFKIDLVEKIATNQARISDSRVGYINQSDIGTKFKIAMSRISVGKLFQITELAQKSSPTRPYMSSIPKYAVIDLYEDSYSGRRYETVKWHSDNCVKYIETWLKKRGYFEEFYTINNEKIMKQFIDKLHIEHVIMS